MWTLKNSPVTRVKRILLRLATVLAVLIFSTAFLLYWAYREQSLLLMSNANRFLETYGIEIIEVQGMQTGLHQARIESINFLIPGQLAVQRIESLTLDYELRTIIRGEFSELRVHAVKLQLQHEYLPEEAEITFANLTLHCQTIDACGGSVAMSASVGQIELASPDIRATRLTANSLFNFDYQAPVLQIDILPGLESGLQTASLSSEDAEQLRVNQLSLLTDQTWRLNINLDEQLVIFDGQGLYLTSSNLGAPADTASTGLRNVEANISRLNGSYDFSDSNNADHGLSRLTSQIELSVNLQLHHVLLPDGAHIALDNISINCLARIACSGSASLNASAENILLTSPNMQATDLTTRSRVEFDYSPPLLSMTVMPGLESGLGAATFNSEEAALPDIAQLSVTSNQAWHINANMDEQFIIVEGGELYLKSLASRLQLNPLEPRLLGFDANVSKLSGSYNFSNSDSTNSGLNLLTVEIDQSALTVAYAIPSDNVHVELSETNLRCLTMTTCSGSIDVKATVGRVLLPSPDFHATDLTASSLVQFDYSAPVLSVTIPPGLESGAGTVRINSEDSALLDIEQLSLVSNQTWHLNLNPEEQLAVFDIGGWYLKAPALRNQPGTEDAGLSGFEADISTFSGRYNFSSLENSTQSALTAQLGLEIRHAYTTLQPFNLWSYRWPVSASWDSDQRFSINVVANRNDRNIASLQLDQDFKDGQGHAEFTTASLAFSSAGDTLSSLISPLPMDADLLSGELSVAAKIAWKMPESTTPEPNTEDGSAFSDWQPTGTLRIEASELTGFIDETVFAGLTTSAEWIVQSDLSLVSSQPTLLRIKELDPGLPLSNIETQFQMNTGSGLIDLSSLTFDLFGGKAETDAFTINVNPAESITDFDDIFEIRLSKIDISKVLAMSAYTGVTATGIVDGILPTKLQGFKPVVEGGVLKATAPGGSIRYFNTGSASGNPSLDLAYQALEHYRYETLNATVDYTEAGELVLDMQLQGVSPQLNDGQRINLNLNIIDNIPALLQSLQAAQSITDRIEELLE